MSTNCSTKGKCAFIVAETCIDHDLSETHISMNVTVRQEKAVSKVNAVLQGITPILNENSNNAQERAATCKETREQFFVTTHTIEKMAQCLHTLTK